MEDGDFTGTSTSTDLGTKRMQKNRETSKCDMQLRFQGRLLGDGWFSAEYDGTCYLAIPVSKLLASLKHSNLGLSDKFDRFFEMNVLGYLVVFFSDNSCCCFYIFIQKKCDDANDAFDVQLARVAHQKMEQSVQLGNGLSNVNDNHPRWIADTGYTIANHW